MTMGTMLRRWSVAGGPIRWWAGPRLGAHAKFEQAGAVEDLGAVTVILAPRFSPWAVAFLQAKDVHDEVRRSDVGCVHIGDRGISTAPSPGEPCSCDVPSHADGSIVIVFLDRSRLKLLPEVPEDLRWRRAADRLQARSVGVFF